MTGDIGNYARHARFWDWGGHDRTPEHERWASRAEKYGKNVLIPMCALGETGAYMSEHGFNVTAFDVTPEMIEEGRNRFGHVRGLRLMLGDVRDFRFDIAPADFCFCCDFGHLHTIEEIKRALICINYHLRDGGCLLLETGLRLPGAASEYFPPKAFYPLRQVYPGLKVWKIGDTRNDAETGRIYITQTFFAEHPTGRTESFNHAFYLQSYYREEWLTALRECGFEIAGEYRDTDGNPWRDGDGYWIAEAVKSGAAAERYSPALKLDHLQTPAYAYENVLLINDAINLERPNSGLFPSYRFSILADGEWAGDIFVKLGYSIRAYYSGQLGYAIKEHLRGRGYATKACIAIKPFLSRCGFRRILITADERNAASRRVCEKIGASLIETVDTPEWTAMYADGQRRTCVYEWDVEEKGADSE